MRVRDERERHSASVGQFKQERLPGYADLAWEKQQFQAFLTVAAAFPAAGLAGARDGIGASGAVVTCRRKREDLNLSAFSVA